MSPTASYKLVGLPFFTVSQFLLRNYLALLLPTLESRVWGNQNTDAQVLVMGPAVKPWAHRAPEWLGKEGCVERIAALAPSYLSRPSSQAFSVWPGHPPASSAVLLAHCVIPARKRGGKHEPGLLPLHPAILSSLLPGGTKGGSWGQGELWLRGTSGFMKTAKQRPSLWSPCTCMQGPFWSSLVSGCPPGPFSPAEPLLPPLGCAFLFTSLGLGKRALMGVFIFILKRPPQN